jgi:3,5-epimerase/4-reductase
MKVQILGATGFMGERCAFYFKSQGHEVITERIDITDSNALRSAFEKSAPEVVINFAGVRAYPTIDWCEDHKEETVAVNVGGVINVALVAIEKGIYVIQIASGCIYSGDESREFTEEDKPNFTGSFYSRMRIAMQSALKELPVLQVRIRMPISMSAHPRNLITKIASYKKVISAPNSVTLIEDMFVALEKLAEIRPVGVLNLTNDGYVTHGDLLSAYKKIVDPNHEYELIDVKELETSVTKAGRSNCILSNKKMKALGIVMSALDEKRLEEILQHYKTSLI